MPPVCGFVPSLSSHDNQNASPLPAIGMLTLDVAWQDGVVHSAPASTFIYLFLEAVNSSAFLPSLSFPFFCIWEQCVVINS